MKHILLCMTGLFLLSTVIYGNAEVPIKPTVILQPSWTQIFSGETVTVRCEIQGGGGTQWTYEWSPAKLNTPPTSNEYRISRATESDSGGYRCRGRRDYLLTGWSDTITLTVSSGKPRATLIAQSSIIPAGGSVTLSCSVEGSAGWKFDWFRRDSVSSEAQLMRGNEANRDIRVSQGGLYHCRGGRGDPAFFSEDSNEVTVEETPLDVKTAALAKSPEEVSGYLGETITLPSGANPSWNLTKIEWSIFAINTWIATYRKGKTNTDRVPQYKGRLSLNTTSGDLTIHNLIADDAREYNVDLLHSEDTANKIILRVKQRLQQPSIQIVTSTSIENGCLMVMHCSSPDNGVTLSWSVEPLGVLTISKRNPSDSSVQLFAFVNTTQNFASFTCNSSRNAESVSSNPVTPKCDGKLCSPV